MQRHKGPVIVDDNGDIDFFPAVDDAERYLEPWCVEYGIVAYDVQGRLLHIEPDRKQYAVSISRHENPKDCSADLDQRVRRFLTLTGGRFGLDEQKVSQATLGELVEWGLLHFAQR
jgi:hypothetical protein